MVYGALCDEDCVSVRWSLGLEIQGIEFRGASIFHYNSQPHLAPR